MQIKTLDERIEELSTAKDFEDRQLYNWLKQLKEYIDRDTPMEIRYSTKLRYYCPKCGELMGQGVRFGFCNKCGQAVKLPD